jgi:hypothetical protein
MEIKNNFELNFNNYFYYNLIKVITTIIINQNSIWISINSIKRIVLKFPYSTTEI